MGLTMREMEGLDEGPGAPRNQDLSWETWWLDLVNDPPFAELVLPTHPTKIAVKNHIPERGATWPYLFWKQVWLIFACLLGRAKTTGRHLEPGERAEDFVLLHLWLPKAVWAGVGQTNHRVNE